MAVHSFQYGSDRLDVDLYEAFKLRCLPRISCPTQSLMLTVDPTRRHVDSLYMIADPFLLQSAMSIRSSPRGRRTPRISISDFSSCAVCSNKTRKQITKYLRVSASKIDSRLGGEILSAPRKIVNSSVPCPESPRQASLSDALNHINFGSFRRPILWWIEL